MVSENKKNIEQKWNNGIDKSKIKPKLMILKT